jgi:hypothetical protein
MSPKQDPGQKNDESEFMDKGVYTGDDKNTRQFFNFGETVEYFSWLT